MKPSLDLRRRLVIAGMKSHDPLEVMNSFNMNEGESWSIGDEYWQTMVAVLCERVCRTEKWLGALRRELAYRHMAESQVLRAAKLSEILMEIATGPAAMNPENQDDVNAVAEASRLLDTFAKAFETTATECQGGDVHHWEADVDADCAVCKVCGKRDSFDVL